jgi:hypothetical protein
MIETISMLVVLIGIFLLIENPVNIYAYDVFVTGLLGKIIARHLGL